MAKGRKRRPKEATEPRPGRAGGEGAGAQPGPAVPRWLPPVLYGAVTLLLFRSFVFTDRMLLGQDTLSLGYMAREFFARALKGPQGFPLWNPIILGGTPFLDSLAGGDSLYPTSLLLLVMEPYRALGWKLVLHVFLAGVFAYGWIRALGLSRGAALLGGLAYLMAPFMVTLVYPGHDGKLFVTALTPLLFRLVERALTRGRLLSFSVLALVVGLVILTTHFQQAYFLFGAAGLYALVRTALLWRRGVGPLRAGFRLAAFLGFSLLGAGVAAIQLLPAVDYVTEWSRRTATTTMATGEGSVEYSSSWSLHPEEVASLVVPEFAGNSAGGAPWAEDTYWGRNVFKLNHEYAGLVVLLLAGVSFLGAPGRGVRWILAGIGLLALLYALGTHTPVWRLFYELVPGISLFRAPSIAAFLFGFSAVTLMAFGAHRVLHLPGEGREGEWKRVLLYLGAAAALLLLCALLAVSGALTAAWTSLLYPDIPPHKAEALARALPFITRGFFLAALLSGGVLGLTWALRAGWIPRGVWAGGVALLLALDLGRVSDPFIQTLDFHAWAAPDPTVRYLQERLEEGEPFRVFSLVQSGQDVRPGMFGVELVGGHHPNDLAPYRELIGMVGSGIPEHLFDPATGRFGWNLLSVLNARYLLWPSYQLGLIPGAEPVAQTTLAGGRPYLALYELPVLPRGRLVGEAVVLPEEEVLPYLLSSSFRPAEEVVLVEEPPLTLPGRPVRGEVRWLERGNNLLRLRVRTGTPALLVLSENWYPAWRARVEGEEVPVLRANHILRAVPVPQGSHEVELFYDPGALSGPMRVTTFSLLILSALLLVGLRERGTRLPPETG